MTTTGSVFEREFDKLQPGHALATTRREAFDAGHALFYSPLKYESIPAPNLIDDLPQPQWVSEAFRAFVRGEFGSRRQVEGAVFPQLASSPEPVDLVDKGTALRDHLEQHLVYGGILEKILAGVRSYDVVERLYALICDDAFGSKENRHNISLDDFRTSLGSIKLGLRLVVPGLPFRDQNPLRTDSDPDDVTLAEAYFLIRMHCTALALYQVLPPGADVLVLSDGTLYAPIFRVADRDAKTYLYRVKQLRDALNLRGTVSIIDLRRLIEIYDRGTGTFHKCVEAIEHLLGDAELGIDTDVAQSFDILDTGMRWNLNTRKSGVSNGVITDWLQGASGAATAALPDRTQVRSIATRYAATNLALRWHQVINRMLPTAVRATMHAKPGQIAFPRLGSVFPWNGVAVVEEGEHEPKNVQIEPLLHAPRKGASLVRRHNVDGKVLYYERR